MHAFELVLSSVSWCPGCWGQEVWQSLLFIHALHLHSKCFQISRIVQKYALTNTFNVPHMYVSSTLMSRLLLLYCVTVLSVDVGYNSVCWCVSAYTDGACTQRCVKLADVYGHCHLGMLAWGWDVSWEATVFPATVTWTRQGTTIHITVGCVLVWGPFIKWQAFQVVANARCWLDSIPGYAVVLHLLWVQQYLSAPVPVQVLVEDSLVCIGTCIESLWMSF